MCDGAIAGCCRKTWWQQVRQRDVGCCVRASVGDGDVKGDNLALRRSARATGKRLNGDQVSLFFNINGFFQIIADRAWVRLIAGCCGDHVGDHHASLISVNSRRNRDNFCITGVDCTNRPQTGGWIISTCSAGVADVSQSRWQLISQRNIGRLSGAVVGNFDLEDDSIANLWSAVSAGQCLNGDKIRVVVHNDGFL